jgi:hypothetical protein
LNSLLKKNNNMSSKTESHLLHKTTTSNLILERLKRDLKSEKKSENHLIIDFISDQIQNLNQAPLLILCKSILIMNDEYFIDLISIVWQLLINSDQEIATSAGYLFTNNQNLI